MRPQISENKLIELFIEVDDLYAAYEQWQMKQQSGANKKRRRQPELHPSEVATIVCAYHLSGYKCFEYYYRTCILEHYRSWFPQAPSYERFVSLLGRAVPLLLLWLLYKMGQSLHTGYYFIDSKKLEVCHLKREKQHRVFEGWAAKGKASTGWFYGLKLHLVINHLGQLVSFALTPGNVADNNQGLLLHLLGQLQGKCGGDKGYLTQLFSYFYENGLHLLCRPRHNMKALPASPQEVRLLKQRAVVESVHDILTSVCDLEHTRHRSPFNALANIYAALIAYQFLEHKPHVFIPDAPNYLMAA